KNFQDAASELEGNRDVLDAAEAEELDAKLLAARDAALERFTEGPKKTLDEVRQLAANGKAQTALTKLDALTAADGFELLELSEEAESVGHEVLDAEAAANSAAQAAWTDRLPYLRRLASARDYSGAARALDDLRRAVAGAGEGEEASRIASRVEEEGGDLA